MSSSNDITVTKLLFVDNGKVIGLVTSNGHILFINLRDYNMIFKGQKGDPKRIFGKDEKPFFVSKWFQSFSSIAVRHFCPGCIRLMTNILIANYLDICPDMRCFDEIELDRMSYHNGELKYNFKNKYQEPVICVLSYNHEKNNGLNSKKSWISDNNSSSNTADN